MAERVSTNEFRWRIGDLLNRVALRHDEFIIERKGKSLAALVSVERFEQMRRFARRHALHSSSTSTRAVPFRTRRPWTSRWRNSARPARSLDKHRGSDDRCCAVFDANDPAPSGTELTMRRLPPLSEFLAIVAERRRALGIDDEAYARACNNGRRRAPEKRELPRRIDRRTREAGLKTFEASF